MIDRRQHARRPAIDPRLVEGELGRRIGQRARHPDLGLEPVGEVVELAEHGGIDVAVPVEVADLGRAPALELERHRQRLAVEGVTGRLEHRDRLGVELGHPDRPRLDPGPLVDAGELVEQAARAPPDRRS